MCLLFGQINVLPIKKIKQGRKLESGEGKIKRWAAGRTIVEGVRRSVNSRSKGNPGNRGIDHLRIELKRPEKLKVEENR